MFRNCPVSCPGLSVLERFGVHRHLVTRLSRAGGVFSGVVWSLGLWEAVTPYLFVVRCPFTRSRDGSFTYRRFVPDQGLRILLWPMRAKKDIPTSRGARAIPEILGTISSHHNALADLKTEYREAIEHVDLAGESVESFAQLQDTTANNVSVRLHRARKAVAKKLVHVCGVCVEHKCLDCTCRKSL